MFKNKKLEVRLVSDVPAAGEQAKDEVDLTQYVAAAHMLGKQLLIGAGVIILGKALINASAAVLVHQLNK